MALRNPSRAAPPELLDYSTACFFWQRISVVSEPPNLDDWPLDRIEKFLTVGDVVDKFQQAMAEINRRQAQRGAGVVEPEGS